MAYRIERIGREDWQRLRKVRLAQLLDTPMAFGEPYEYARHQGEGNWRARTNWVNEPDKIGLVAVDDTGEWVGTMLSVPNGEHPRAVDLIGVWVDPAHRGRELGVADALLDAVLAWARVRRAGRMLLGVHEANHRAAAFYRRRGFAYTGGETPYVLDREARILEMALPLE
ncbi:GNAT family N-acetyltransferase [Kitasatospora sp. SUK 42]|uniref:GNAT family N-acetyltransferase n=1 Tax=Kitasatospora sp. SUK 42 TaxID=1588882 RepID=UPI0018CA6A93|nr:GNAT family N-acetyltransferase [Kitasatospora sp. SUK 42]MBV2153108.1 GNAT family N-acetyltransferase [Kitasatospora sp. SUK 42]